MFWYSVDQLVEQLWETIQKNVPATGEGFSVALEATQELLQTLLMVPKISELEALGKLEDVETLLNEQ